MRQIKRTKSSATAILRFSNVSELHEKLTKLLGVPSASFKKGELKNNRTKDRWTVSLWAQESTLNAFLNVNVHLEWAAALVAEHEIIIGEWIRSGVNVSLHLACHSTDDDTMFTLEPKFLAPFVAANIPIEIRVDKI